MSSFATPYIGIALGITSQAWEDTGLANDDPATAPPEDVEDTATRITALLLIKICAWVMPRGVFTDLSTTTMCRSMLVDVDDELWPRVLTEDFVNSLKDYVRTILGGYNPVPYHNFKHCYHVTISTNKLVDMIVHVPSDHDASQNTIIDMDMDIDIDNDNNINNNIDGNSNSNNNKNKSKTKNKNKNKTRNKNKNKNKNNDEEEGLPNTFGFRDDPLMQFTLLFSALIHDVDHRGIPNRQLAMEDEDLAIKYNDQSIAENESLFIGFSELLRPKYDALRGVLFPEREDYRRFRRACINLVLTTDIASPERTQLGTSKWKEAFGDPYETVERKVMKKVHQQQQHKGKGVADADPAEILTHMKVKDGTETEDDSSSAASSAASSEDENEDENEKKPNTETGSKTNTNTETKTKTKKIMNKLHGKALKFHRRLSQVTGSSSSNDNDNTTTNDTTTNNNNNTTNNNTPTAPPRRARLGFRRTMDLTGESIETYAGDKRLSASGEEDPAPRTRTARVPPPEKIDELREAVIMETILKSADVGHNLQGFEQMARWSDCLYMELRKAFVDHRGEDPVDGWFHNQIGFLDFYLLPLARKLDDTGAFGDTRGGVFAAIVASNRKRWIEEGMGVTTNIVERGVRYYPNY